MPPEYDLVILGSGFGGALLSMVAHRLGLSVLLIERGKHPRFAIGESTSPLANLLLEQIALRYDLPRLLPLTTYGTWQRTYPEVVCGLKRGFTYYHHEAGKPHRATPNRENQLLVAASPNNDVSDMHWLRSDVDYFLVKEALALGVEYREEAQVTEIELESAKGITLRGTWQGKTFAVRARLLIDATGPRGALSRAWKLPESTFTNYPPTQTLFSHFVQVPRCEEMETYHTEEMPPYAPDDAALHHVFAGGWMWVLRFNNGVTSAGIAVTDALAQELGLSEGEAAWPRFLRRFPSIEAQFAPAEAIRPFIYAPRLAYRCATAAGENWALLPSAAGFVDPLFSTGIPLTLLGIERLGRILEESWNQPTLPARLAEYGAITLEELDWTARFIAACYATLDDFPRFAAFSMFYFAAASFSEMARRLDRPQFRRFLAADHPVFAPGFAECGTLLMNPQGRERMGKSAFAHYVAERIACLNVAGLSGPSKRNWYPVDMQDVITSAEKFGFTAAEMRQILTVAPWAQGML
jgi:FADH2 O2-dependent halogenase